MITGSSQRLGNLISIPFHKSDLGYPLVVDNNQNSETKQPKFSFNYSKYIKRRKANNIMMTNKRIIYLHGITKEIIH